MLPTIPMFCRPPPAPGGPRLAPLWHLYASLARELCPLVARAAVWLAVLVLLAWPASGFAADAPREVLPVTSLLWSLRAMVGSWLVLLLVVCVLVWRGPGVQTGRGRFALWACVLTLPLPWIAMISGWLVLELGQRPQAGAAVVAAQATGTRASMAALLGWGSAYAVLMLVNLKLSLRWLRLDAGQIGQSMYGGVTAVPAPAPAPKPRPRSGGALIERLAQRYRPGVGESEFDEVVEEHEPEPDREYDRAPQRTPHREYETPRLTHRSDEGANDQDFDVDKLRRAIARLRKERNALRKVVKAKKDHPAAAPARAVAPNERDGGDTQRIPVLRDVVHVRRS